MPYNFPISFKMLNKSFFNIPQSLQNMQNLHQPTELIKIFTFQQPLPTLRNNDDLCPLQESPYSFFSDRIKTQLPDHLPTLRKKLLHMYKPQVLYFILIVQITVVIKVSLSYMLQLVLADLRSYQNMILLAMLFVFQVLFEQHYFQNIYQASQKIRYALIHILYTKLQSTTLTRITEVSRGQFFNLISMDLSDIDLTWILAAFGAPTVMILGLYHLFDNFGLCSIVGVGILCAIMYLQKHSTGLTGNLKREKTAIQDQRSRITEELLQHLKVMKMYTIEFLYREKILSKREEQDNKAKEILALDALSYTLNSNMNVFISLTLMLFAYQLTGNQINSEQIFSSIWILQLIKVWCITYPQRAYKAIINLRVLENRLIDILNVQDLNTIAQKALKESQKKKKKYVAFKEEEEQSAESEEIKSSDHEPPQIVFINYTGYWSKINEMQNQPVLEKVSLVINQPGIYLICGPVGSSKSSFLQAILHELPYHSGSIKVSGNIAYVEQQPFVFSGTFKDNILFGNGFNQATFQACIQASALHFDNIDENFQVGDNGCNLSGGQKARLSFCRALYSDADIFLLDDVLSAVDKEVSNHLVSTLMELKRRNKIIILVTHKKIQADRVFCMEAGKLQEQENEEKVVEEETMPQVEEQKDLQINSQEQAQQDPEVNVYRQFFSEGGDMWAIMVLGLYLIDALFNLTIMKCLGASEMPWLLIFGQIMVNYAKFRGLFELTITAINNMHRKMLTFVTRSRIGQICNVGQMMSRFTTDLNNIEGMVMLDLHWVIEGLIDNAFIIIVVSLNSQIIFISSGFLVTMFLIKQYFGPAMKKALLSDDSTRAHLYSKLQNSIDGLTIIRAYAQQEQFIEDFLTLIYKNMQAQFTFLRLNALLAFVIELSLQLLIIAAMFILSISSMDKERIGFSVLMLMQLGYIFSLNLRGQIYLDIDMENVRRVMSTYKLAAEEYGGREIVQWSEKGTIEFRNVYMSYGSQAVLKNISFSIESGKSLGIVGRTGAGKSSIINALFRLFNIQSGAILIDGEDISSINLLELRQRLVVIPQSCPQFSLSLRFNLDPKNLHSDEELLAAIKEVGLEFAITDLHEANVPLSAGQKQLLALCKVILDKTKSIVIFDEATSNIDYDTERKISEILQKINATKIIIAHRPATVQHCDQIITLSDGEIQSITGPSKSLQQSVDMPEQHQEEY